MPESNFKGLFMKLYQWATQDGINRQKLLTFYQIVDRLTDALKHLFTIFAATVVSHAVTVMGSFHVGVKKGKSSQMDLELGRKIADDFSLIDKLLYHLII